MPLSAFGGKMQNITVEDAFLTHHNSKQKDTLFRKIFGGEDEKSARWRLELYNALSGKHHTNPADLEITTLENVIYIHMKNDMSFLVDSQMTLYEQQSTFNPNMPLRGLMYFAMLYQVFVTNKEKDLFGSKLVKIPSPRYIVFYNGDRKVKETIKLKLSDAFIDFEERGDFEWTATMININLDVNLPLQKNCKPLYDYIRYVDRVKVNLKQKMERTAAIEEAIQWAIKEELLEGLFKEQKAEVLAMSLTELDQDLYDRCRRQEGYEDGVADGAHDKAVETARNFLKMAVLSTEQIAQGTGLPLEKVLELKEKLKVQN